MSDYFFFVSSSTGLALLLESRPDSIRVRSSRFGVELPEIAPDFALPVLGKSVELQSLAWSHSHLHCQIRILSGVLSSVYFSSPPQTRGAYLLSYQARKW